jgi:ribosomal protein S18 acetylase RimI-like enzyme
MTRATIVVGDPTAPGAAWLRAVAAADQERLRGWRNAAAHAFFERSPVDAAGQRRWFEGYLGRDEDFLFMVMDGTEACGCVGVRLAAGEWDVYNVIRGARTPGSRGFMGRGLELLVGFARRRAGLPVRAVVLAGNPAIAWYERHGFGIAARREGSVVMRWTEGPATPAAVA